MALGISEVENLERTDLGFFSCDGMVIAGAQNEMGDSVCCRPPNHTGVEDGWLL